MKMVRAVVLAAALGATAAVGGAAQPVIGFRLGVSMSKGDIESPDFEGVDRSWLTSFIGGGFIRFGAGTIALQPELMYVTKGVKFEDEATGEDASLQMDYLEVPVLLFLGLGTGVLTPYLVAGPAFAFETKCRVELNFDTGSFEGDCDDAEAGAFERKKFDVGAMFGGGLAFPTGPGSVIIDGRYNLGLINIIDDETEDEFKHRAFSFTAGYQIPLGIR
jgi:hypothetical protein